MLNSPLPKRNMMTSLLWIALLLWWSHESHALSFVPATTQQSRAFAPATRHLGYTRRSADFVRASSSSSSLMTMKDHSASMAFSVGATVQVVQDVIKAGQNLQGRTGRILETWEKCDVDPTCCCAEQVDPNMAVRVQFAGTERDETAPGTFEFYFAEDELQSVPKKNNKDDLVVQEANPTTLPFDGKGCVAFKMEQLNMENKPRKLAQFDPNSPEP